jgi:hypothetical protein
MTQRCHRSDYVQEDGTWFDPTPRASISRTPVIRYADEEDPNGDLLLLQLLEPLPGRFVWEIPETRSSM